MLAADKHPAHMQAAAEAEQLHNSGRNLALAVAVAAAHQKLVAAEPSPGRWAVWSVAHNPSLVAEQMELEEQAVLLELAEQSELLELVEQQELLELVIVSVQAAEVLERVPAELRVLQVAQVRGEQEPGALPLARLQVAEVLERVPELVARQALLVAQAVLGLQVAEEQERVQEEQLQEFLVARAVLRLLAAEVLGPELVARQALLVAQAVLGLQVA